MDLGDSFQRAHHFTRTSLKNIERFREALGLAPAEAEITENRKVEVSVDFFGDWFFTFRTLAVTNVTKVTFIIFNMLICIMVFQFSSDEACEYVSEGCKFFGKMTKDGNSLTFHGIICQEEEMNPDPRSYKSSVELIAIWNVSSTSIVQSTTLILDSGHSGKSPFILNGDFVFTPFGSLCQNSMSRPQSLVFKS